MGDVVDATKKSVAAADHLEHEGKDAGAIAALIAAARKIDDWDVLLNDYFEHREMNPDEKPEKPPAQDNSTLGTYLKFCESLGLTPASRGSLGKPAVPKVENELEDFITRKKAGAAGR
jgi:hypothetical protein